jgi:hypothetical protein
MTSIPSSKTSSRDSKIVGQIWDGGARGVYDVRFNYLVLNTTKDYENAHISSLLLKQYGTRFSTNPTTGQARAYISVEGLKKLQEACDAHFLGVSWMWFTNV